MTSRGLNSWVSYRNRIYNLPNVGGLIAINIGALYPLCPRKSYGEQSRLALRLIVRQLGDATAENKQNSLSEMTP